MDENAPDQQAAPDPITSQQITCPHCAGAIDAPTIQGPIIVCPYCGGQFFAPQTGVDDETESGEPAEEKPDTEAELSELRIRQLSTLRRTAYRSRSYLIVGTIGCLVLAIQLIISSVKSARYHDHLGLVQITGLLFALAALIGAYYFGRLAMEIQRGINDSLREREREEAEAAKHEPDFSLLSDGSQRVDNLHRMFGNGGSDPK